MRLSQEEKERYSRQLMIFKESGQKKLKAARVLIAGAGGLGSVAAKYLAMAGVGIIRLVDKGEVDLPDLNRQHYTLKDVCKPKVTALSEKLQNLNMNAIIEPEYYELTEKNVQYFVGESSVVLDCLDNLKSRLILSRACQKLKKPLVHGTVEGMTGYQLTCLPGGPYLDRLYTKKKGADGTFPILGPVAGLIGTLQALEAIQIITGCGKPNTRLLVFDGKENRFEYTRIRI